MSNIQFTLVSTVFNEAKRLKDTIEDLKNQSVSPSEIIITDAGSNDGTVEILEDWKRSSSVPIKILIKPRCNVAEGRNLAINNSSYETIVSTDFGCRFHKDWLKSLTEPLVDENIMVVGGSFSVIEEDQKTLAAKAAYILNNGYKVDVNAPWFIPSSRSIAYRKSVFKRIGGYCEWLTLAADDSVFGKELLAHNFKIFMVNKPYVFWGRHSEFKAYEKEAFRYGLGDGESRIGLFSKVKSLMYVFLRILFLLGMIAIIINLINGSSIAGISVITLISLLGFRPYYLNLFKPWIQIRSDKYTLNVLVASVYLLEAVQFHYYRGYFRGYFFSKDKIKNDARLLRIRLEGQL